MKRRMLHVLLPTLATAALYTPAAAQADATGNAAVGTVHTLWQQLTAYITTAAEDAPDSLYAYRPTPEVRTFGQLVGHVAGAQHLICSAALGEPGGAEDDIEKTVTDKAGLVAALKASTEYCERAYAQSDADAQQPTKLFGQDRTRFFALTLNATHNGEHYGNIVTYLRINGIVPPSSRPTS